MKISRFNQLSYKSSDDFKNTTIVHPNNVIAVKKIAFSIFVISAVLPKNHGPIIWPIIRKIDKKEVVVRNKIKRRLRVIAKNIIGEYGIKNWNYVIIGKKSSLIEDFKNLEFEMNTAIKKIHS